MSRAGETSAQGRCPICGNPASARVRPFCSARCADADLHSWLTDRYAVPVGDDDEDRGDETGRDPPGQGESGTL